MAFDTASLANILNSSYSNDLSNGVSNNVFPTLSKAMDNSFQMGVPSLTNVDITTPKGTLSIVATPSPELQPTEIANKVQAYWAMAILPSGIPVGGGTWVITSVINDSPKIVQPIINQLLQLAKDTPERKPHFKDFLDVIFNNVKTIIWTVIEVNTVNGSSATYTVTVS